MNQDDWKNPAKQSSGNYQPSGPDGCLKVLGYILLGFLVLFGLVLGVCFIAFL